MAVAAALLPPTVTSPRGMPRSLGRPTMDPRPLPNLWPGNCFGCSPRNPHGLKLQFSRTRDGVSTRCELDRHLCGMDGVAHGGIVATLLDEASAWALVVHAGRLGFATDMNIRFAKPVQVGAPLVVQAFVVELDANDARTFAEVKTGHDTMLAVATSTWTLLSPAVAAGFMGLDCERLEQFIAAVYDPAKPD